MNRISLSILGLMLATAALSTGCGAQHAPFKFRLSDDADHYNKVATEIEYPNIADCPSDSAITCPSPEAIGPDSHPTYWDMKLEEAMQLGLAKSKVLHDLGGTVLRSPPNIRTIADPAIIDTDPKSGVEAALSEFDATFNSRVDYQRNNRFINNVFFGGGTRDLVQDTDVFRSDITKTAATGSQFTFAHNTVYDHNNSPGNLFGSSWDTNFEASVRQPLLQGAGVEYNRIAGPKGSPGNLNGVLIARVNTDISLADFELGLRDMVSNIENAYWDLYFAYRDLDAKIAARDNALESWRKTHALFLAGRRGGEAEKEAEARLQYFQFQEEVQNAWSGRLNEGTQTNNGSGGGTFRAAGGVRVCERRLRFLIGLPANDGRLIRPADEPSLAKVVFNWDEILPEAINRRPELRRQRWVIKRGELALIASRNFLLPKLDTFGLYRIRGFGRDLKDGMDNTTENSAFADLTSGQHQEWEVGMELSVPLGERQGHAAVRNAQLVLSRERAILDDQERQVVLDVSNAVGEVDRAYQAAQTAYNRRMAAKADVASTKAAYESDKAPLDLYLEAQRRIAEAESLFFAALVEYELAIKNLHYAKGSLLDYNEVYLSEGPWPGKAYKDAANRQSSRWQPHALNYIFHQGSPVSGGTEPNYPLPPPVGPLPGPPAGSEQVPVKPLEEIPSTTPQPQTVTPPATTDRRSAPPGTTLRAYTPQPTVQPARQQSTAQQPAAQQQAAQQQAAQQPLARSQDRAATDANHPPLAPQTNNAPQSTYSFRSTAAPRPTVAPQPVPAPQPTQWSLRTATLSDSRPIAAQPATPRFAAVQPSTSEPAAAASAPSAYGESSFQRSPADNADPSREQKLNNNSQSNDLNWRPLPDKSAAVERWPIPVSQISSSSQQTNDRSPTRVGSERPPVVRPADQTSASQMIPREPDAPRESVFVSSARSQQPGAAVESQPSHARPVIINDSTVQPRQPLPAWQSTESLTRRLPPIVSAADSGVPPEPARSASWPESTLRPLPPVGNTNTYFVAPAAQNNNYVRPTSYPSDSGSTAQPWPATEVRLLPPVQSTDYSTAPSDPQRPAATQPLPPTSKIQPLPPVNSPLDRLPPVGP
jgi:outer membrane protein TolC